MSRYKILADENIILADRSFMETQYESDEYELLEDPPEVVIPKTQFTKFEFRNLFTFEELIAIEEAATTDAGVRVLKDNQALAEFIDITDPNTIAGVNYLVAKTLLTQERANVILNIIPPSVVADPE